MAVKAPTALYAHSSGFRNDLFSFIFDTPPLCLIIYIMKEIRIKPEESCSIVVCCGGRATYHGSLDDGYRCAAVVCTSIAIIKRASNMIE
jgi:hypothetical protein